MALTPAMPGFPFVPLWAEWSELAGLESAALVLVALVALYLVLFLVRPYTAVWLAMLVLTRSLLWLRSRGRAHVPATGPVLLLCNPLSYLGWLLLLTACPRRVRFLILAGWTDQRHPRLAAPPRRGHHADRQRRRRDRTRPSPGPARRWRPARSSASSPKGAGSATARSLPMSQVFDRLQSRIAQRRSSRSACTSRRAACSACTAASSSATCHPEFPSPVWVRFGEPLPAGTSAAAARQAMQDLSARLAVERRGHARAGPPPLRPHGGPPPASASAGSIRPRRART